MKKKFLYIIYLFLLLVPINILALDSLEFKNSNKNINVGEEFTVSIDDFTKEGDLSDNYTIDLTSSNNDILSISGTKVKALKEGNATVSATIDGKSANLNVIVKEKELTISFNNDNLELEVNATKDLPELKYSRELKPSEKVTYSSSDNNIVTVTQEGKITALKKGNATVTAKITENIKATINIKVNDKEEKIDYRVKSFKITGAELVQKFNPDEYYFDLKDVNESAFKISNIQLYASDKDAYAVASKLNNTEDKSLKEAIIDVYNKDKRLERTYTFKYKIEAKDTTLKSLKIPGYPFEETFSSDKKAYVTTIPYEVNMVTVEYTACDGCKVVVSGENNLKVGSNIVQITVTNGNDSSQYKIHVNRSEKTSLDEEATSIIKTSSLDTSTSSDEIVEKDTANPFKPINIFFVTLASIILLLIGSFGIYFFIKTSPKRMKKELLAKKNEENPIIEVENKIEDTKEFK